MKKLIFICCSVFFVLQTAGLLAKPQKQTKSLSSKKISSRSAQAEIPQNKKSFEERFEEDYKLPQKTNSIKKPLWLMGKMIFYCVLVVIFLYMVLRFILSRKKWITGENAYLSLLSTVAIAPNRYMGIVDVAGELIVVGITDHNIQTLYEIKDKEKADMIRLSYQRKLAPVSFFKEISEKFKLNLQTPLHNEERTQTAMKRIVSEKTEHLRRIQNEI